jgi:D-alanyl-D-alanine carboxypeptidase
VLLSAVLPVVLVAVGIWIDRRDERGSASASSGSPVLPSPARGAAPQPGNPLAVSLEGVDAFHVRFRKPPRAGLVFDLDSGEVLWRRDPLRTLPIASLTKIMTALLVVERTDPLDQVRITKAALNYQGSGVGLLPKGRHVPLEALLNGMLIVSGNDAAIALAVHVAGSEPRFVGLMNQRARQLGLRCTHFASSHGLEAGNRSCASDLATLSREAMRQFRIARVVRKKSAALRFPIKARRIFLYAHNPLLRAGYRGTIGLKTGFTNAAGRCFVGVVRRGGRTLGVVLLHSPDPARQARRLLNEGFASG